MGTHFSFEDVGKFAAMIAVVCGFFSPLLMLPLFAPLKRSKHRESMWMDHRYQLGLLIHSTNPGIFPLFLC